MAVNPLRLDPTRTTLLRQAFVADMHRRMMAIRRAVIQLVDVEDAFGLKRAGQLTTPQAQATTTSTIPLDKLLTNARWQFGSDDKKLTDYQEWLKGQVDQNLLSVDPHNKNAPWLQPYIGRAYKKGVERAYTDTSPKGEDLSFIEGGKAAFMKMSFQGPVMQSKLKTLSTRAFTNLKGVTADMDKQMTTVLANGLAKGTGAAELGKQLADTVTGLDKTRAATIARTEIIHAHNEGQLDSFEAMNQEGVGVMAEWSTAHDGKVCPLCAPLEGVILKIAEARGMLPRHPNCRCAWIPANVGEEDGGTTQSKWAGAEQGLEEPGTAPTGQTTGQVWSKDEIGARIRESFKAEHPSLDTVEARAASRWIGADLKITGKLKPGSKAYEAAQAAEKAAAQIAATAAKEEAEQAAAARALEKSEKIKAKLAEEKAAQEAKAAADAAAKLTADAAKAVAKWEGPGYDAVALDHAAWGGSWDPPTGGATQSYGMVLFDDQGRVLLRSPKGHYGGTTWTFAKGGGTLPGTTALKELAEETGHKGAIFDYVPGAFKGQKTKTNFFIGKSVGYDAALMDKETYAVKWMTYDEAKAAIALSKDAVVAARDRDILEAAYKQATKSTGIGIKVLADNGAAKLKELQDTAAKAAHSHKVKTGMAQQHFAKPKFGGGVTDADYVAATKQKLGPTGINKILSEKGWHLSTVPAHVGDALTQADDIVAQKAAFDNLKYAPKGVAKIDLAPGLPPATRAEMERFIAEGKDVGFTPDEVKSGGKWDKTGDWLPVPTTGPLEKNLKKIKDLPGSTKPYLAEDTVTGAKWVVKDVEGSGIKPAHLRSEANADQLYRTLGFAVPKSKIIESAGGPMKVAEYLDGGQTLAAWKAGKTEAEVKAMYKEIRKGYVADALFANHDVAGLSYDNIFIKDGKAYRIDNGGALTFRAQGGKKAGWGPKVTDLASMKDKATNPVTASIYDGITDDEVHAQIRHIVANRDALLAAVEDDKTRATLAARIDDLQAKLPAQAAQKAPPAGRHDPNAGLTAQTPERVVQARANGHNIAIDHADIEDNNALAWEELDAKGNAITHIQLKVTAAGSDKINAALGDELKAAKVLSPVSTVHPEDTYYTTLLKTAKTVGHHAKDGNYNQATLTEFKEAQKKLSEALHGAKGDTKAMLEHYDATVSALHKAIVKKEVPPVKVTQYVHTPVEAKEETGRRLRRDIRVRQDSTLDFHTVTFEGGVGKVTPGKNDFNAGNVYALDMGEGIKVHYLPRNTSYAQADGRALHGTVRVTVPAKATEETLNKAMKMLSEVGLDTATPTAAYEESLYLYKGVYLNKKADTASYKAIWGDKGLTDAERVVAQKKWIKDNMGIDPEKSPSYNPAGTTKNADGSGYRHWTRWDLDPATIQKEMKGYTLSHSPSGGLAHTLAGVLDSGGEFTSTTGRIRKGVDVSATGGMSSSSDIKTGGASYFFTRIKQPKSDDIAFHFKIDNLARLDTVSYRSDKYGAISELGGRATGIPEYKEIAKKHASNETLFKEGLSIGDLDSIVTRDATEQAKVLKVFADRGIDKLPDGRPVTDIVKVRK